MSKKVWQVLGYVDAYGAVHYHKIFDGDDHAPNHADLWPTVSHNRFRFIVSDWNLTSFRSNEKFDPEATDAILRKMEKILPVPDWVCWGNFWEAKGRPHGVRGDRVRGQWEKMTPKQKQKWSTRR